MSLRGHVVLSESAVEQRDLSSNAHIFSDDVLIPAGMYVILYSGDGEPRWARTKDGAMVYYVYMNRESPVWDRCVGSLHVLSTQHTYAERRETELVGARMV